MKQVVLNYNSGELSVEDVPVPICKSGHILVRTAYSLVSAGTEGMKTKQAQMSLLQMAKERPDKVKQVMKSVRQSGVLETYHKVKERLDALTPLGYSLSGIVEQVGEGIDTFVKGNRVSCAGEAIACHAEYVTVPRNLCVPVSENVDLKDAAFATVGAIALNGVRQAGVTIGDSVLIIGLGLVGLLGIQLLKAAGCQVIGIDINSERLALAKKCGADIAIDYNDTAMMDTIQRITNGIGPDVVYISASTKSSDPLDLGGKVVRDRGKIVIVGMIPIQANWNTYYKKEISIIMSRSYGPGRYDPSYEYKGVDYPVGYVRWTENRNLVEYLRLISTGQINPSLLDSKIFPIDQAPTAYRMLNECGNRKNVSILFEYPQDEPIKRILTVSQPDSVHVAQKGIVSIGMLGAGNFSTGTLIPALKKISGVQLHTICSAGGLSAKSAARRHGFAYVATDYAEMINNPDIHAIIIATRHDTHAKFVVDCLRSGKHVFVEKPLALNQEQLDDVVAAMTKTDKILMVGFNRRFSPLVIAIRDYFASRTSPIEVLYRVSAGKIESDSWYKDDEEGGWRVISEGCHFVDVIQFICGCAIQHVSAQMIEGTVPGEQNDNFVATFKMEDGSLGTLLYVANGCPYFDKEYIEVFGQGRTAIIENFQRARIFHNGKKHTIRARGSGKGHLAELESFIQAIRSGAESPLSFLEAVNATQATFRAVQAMQKDSA